MARNGPDDHRASARTHDARELANQRDAVFRTQRAEAAAGVVDDTEVEAIRVERKLQLGDRFGLYEDAERLTAFLRALDRGRVASDDDTPGQAGLHGDRSNVTTVRATDLHNAIAQFHAAHSDDERMWRFRLRETIQKHTELLDASFRLSAISFQTAFSFSRSAVRGRRLRARNLRAQSRLKADSR